MSSTQPLGNEIILIVIIALFGVILAIETKYWFGRKGKVDKSARLLDVARAGQGLSQNGINLK